MSPDDTDSSHFHASQTLKYFFEILSNIRNIGACQATVNFHIFSQLPFYNLLDHKKVSNSWVESNYQEAYWTRETVCVCVNMCMFLYIYRYIFLYIHTFIRVCMHLCMSIWKTQTEIKKNSRISSIKTIQKSHWLFAAFFISFIPSAYKTT